MKQIMLLLLLAASPLAARSVAPGVLLIPGMTPDVAMARMAADCTTLGRTIDAQTETDLSCSSVLTDNSQIACKAAFFAWPNCPDTARDIRRYAVAATADGVQITYIYMISKKPGDEKPYVGAGKNGPEPELRAIFPEAR